MMQIKIQTRGHNVPASSSGGLAYGTLEGLVRTHWLTEEQAVEIRQGKVVEYADANFTYYFSQEKI